jgi:hypothetical protein
MTDSDSSTDTGQQAADEQRPAGETDADPPMTRRQTLAMGAGVAATGFLGISLFDNVGIQHGGEQILASPSALNFDAKDFTVEESVTGAVDIALSDAATSGGSGSGVESTTPVREYAIGPAELANADYAQRHRYVPDGSTLTLTGWGCRTSAETSPTGLKLVLNVDGTDQLTVDGTAWTEQEAAVDGPADVYFQLDNQTGNNLTSDSTAADWAAASYEFTVE